MTRDEIVKMAAEIWNAGSSFPIPSSDDVLRFAALVAAAEREAIIAIIHEHDCQDGVLATDDVLAVIRARGGQ